MNIWDTIKDSTTTPFNMYDSFMHPEKGYNAAGDRMEGGWQEALKYLLPYMQNGNNQSGALNDAAGNLMDPTKLQGDWISKYEQSPWATQLMDQGKASGLDAASQMGLMGSSSALENIEKTGTNIMQSDRSNYLNDLMKKYMAGIDVRQNMYNTGANAAGNLASGAIETGKNVGEMKYGAQNAPGEMMSKLLGMAAGMFAGGA